MRRRLFNLAAAVSLLLWSASVALWLKSYSGVDEGFVKPGRTSLGIASANGMVGISCNTDYPSATRARWRSGLKISFDPLQYCDHHAGPFGYYYGYGTSPGKTAAMIRVVVMPHWTLVLIFSVLPGVWLVWIIRGTGTTPRHLCPTCGYDLRATPERCPECGTAVALTSIR